MLNFFHNVIKKSGFRIVEFSSLNNSVFGTKIPNASEFYINAATGKIFFKILDIELDIIKHNFFCRNYQYAKDLKQLCNAEFSVDKSDVIFCKIQGIKIEIQIAMDISSAFEIFVKSCYHFITDENFIFFDIGMNVGITSLYFSSNPLCKKIFAFEPFVPTYEQALKNISLNNGHQKIIAYNQGLGIKNETLELDYSSSNRLGMSTTYVHSSINEKSEVQKCEVNIVKASEVFAKIFNEEGADERYVVKLDCEGAEYGILNDLAASGMLRRINILMIEWHFKGPDDLCRELINAGFEIFSLHSFDKSLGMIYAVNSKKIKQIIKLIS